MAGSYNHIVDDEGKLLDGEGINGMLECMSGDVVECVEEMYGMIWYLAYELAMAPSRYTNFDPDNPGDKVEEARQNFLAGFHQSPSREGRGETNDD